MSTPSRAILALLPNTFNDDNGPGARIAVGLAGGMLFGVGLVNMNGRIPEGDAAGILAMGIILLGEKGSTQILFAPIDGADPLAGVNAEQIEIYNRAENLEKLNLINQSVIQAAIEMHQQGATLEAIKVGAKKLWDSSLTAASVDPRAVEVANILSKKLADQYPVK
jgi:hypothetical protein